MTVVIYSSQMIDIAVNTYNIAKKEESSSNISSDNAIISIVFAHVYLESFINEIMVRHDNYELENVVYLKRIWKDIQNLRIAEKYKIVFTTFTGKEIKKNQFPINDLILLSEIRNRIIHIKPAVGKYNDDGLYFDDPSFIKQLENRGVIEPWKGSILDSWLSRIANDKVAKWACETAINIQEEMINSIPTSEYSNKMKRYYSLEDIKWKLK